MFRPSWTTMLRFAAEKGGKQFPTTFPLSFSAASNLRMHTIEYTRKHRFVLSPGHTAEKKTKTKRPVQHLTERYFITPCPHSILITTAHKRAVADRMCSIRIHMRVWMSVCATYQCVCICMFMTSAHSSSSNCCRHHLLIIGRTKKIITYFSTSSSIWLNIQVSHSLRVQCIEGTRTKRYIAVYAQYSVFLSSFFFCFFMIPIEIFNNQMNRRNMTIFVLWSNSKRCSTYWKPIGLGAVMGAY